MMEAANHLLFLSGAPPPGAGEGSGDPPLITAARHGLVDSVEGLLAKDTQSEIGMRAERRGDPVGDWRRERWATRFNEKWSNIIAAWAHLLTETGSTTRSAFGLQEGTGIDAVFKVSPFTGFSRPSHHHTYFNRSE